MANLDSFSSKEPSLEERLGELEQSLGKLQTYLKEKGFLPGSSSSSDGERLESVNNDLCKLREEFESSSEEQADFNEGVSSNSKMLRTRLETMGKELLLWSSPSRRSSQTWASKDNWIISKLYSSANVFTSSSMILVLTTTTFLPFLCTIAPHALLYQCGQAVVSAGFQFLLDLTIIGLCHS
jgi:hypothetical protein